MDFSALKQKVTDIITEADVLAQTIINQPHQKTLDGFIEAITRLSEFLTEDKNISALEKYEAKPADRNEDCPLDSLCKDIVVKLEAIELQLNNSIFDFLRPENSPTTNPRMVRQISRTPYNSNSINNFLESINGLFSNNLTEGFNILKHLGGHNKTLIVLGPNGSGKTSFTKYLKKVESHVRVIPANKPIVAEGHIPSIYNSTVKTFNDELYGGNQHSQDLLNKLIIGLCSEHDDLARKYKDSGENKESLYDRIKTMFDSFFDVKLDNSDFGNKAIKGKKSTGNAYPFNSMSEGERVAFFYIATVVVAPSQSFIIVDEPETYLNPAIYNKIWDKLMDFRKDCQFIFISHTMDFINARSDFELLKIKSFSYPDKFEFEFLGSSLENLDTNFIAEVVGSRKPILFCEGAKSDTDYDYKVYESLVGNLFTVIPTGNCLSVENSVVACNKHASTYSIQSAKGMIDSDLKSADEVSKLKESHVFVLQCNEIEMLLIDELIFKAVLELFEGTDANKQFSEFKVKFFEKLIERKDHMIKRIVKIQIDEKLQNTFIDDKNNKTKDELKMNLTDILQNININLDALWVEANAKIEDIVARQDYDAALKYCCLEHTEVLFGLTKPFVSDYTQLALGRLRADETLGTLIRTKYLTELLLSEIIDGSVGECAALPS
jgi:energy-coupling factor transporter ATP-binding protein EcfA2